MQIAEHREHRSQELREPDARAVVHDGVARDRADDHEEGRGEHQGEERRHRRAPEAPRRVAELAPDQRDGRVGGGRPHASSPSAPVSLRYTSSSVALDSVRSGRSIPSCVAHVVSAWRSSVARVVSIVTTSPSTRTAPVTGGSASASTPGGSVKTMVAVRSPRHEVRRRAQGHEAARDDHRHAVRERLRLLHVVRREQDRRAQGCAATRSGPTPAGGPTGRSRSSARRGRAAGGRPRAPGRGRAVDAGRPRGSWSCASRLSARPTRSISSSRIPASRVQGRIHADELDGR